MWASICVATIIGCGPDAPPKLRTILTTETERADGGDAEGKPFKETASVQAPQDLRARIIQDGRTAAEILIRSACKDETDSGSLAAVYALRVGLPISVDCAGSALARGTTSEKLLVRAVSWANLAAHPDLSLPKNGKTAISAEGGDDPAVQVLSALAFLVREAPVPEALCAALNVPDSQSPPGAKAADTPNETLSHLAIMAQPFDSGLLAPAVAFVEARFVSAAETSQDGPVRTASRLQREILSALAVEAPTECPSVSAVVDRPSSIGELLENRLAAQPRAVLNSMVLNAEPSLRISALRALTISRETPTVTDLGAAAAALQAEDASLRIEGARTFLLLVRRIGN